MTNNYPIFLNGNCIPIASIIRLPFTLEFFANNSVPNVLINLTGPAKIDHVSANYTELYFC